MNYLSVCSGIEAATVAWEPLGFKPIGFSEIEEFPCAVLRHHYPEVKNFGDMTQFGKWDINAAIDILVGGTNCQSFSIAGLRKGLADPRGNLMLIYLAIAQCYRPRWIVWENVPGVLSSNRGRNFGTFLGALGGLGYGWSYRVLDARWFGLAQRRKRLFVVGHLGNFKRAATVLFESESVRRDTPTIREKKEETAAAAAGSAGNRVEGCLNRMVAFGEYKNDGTASCLKNRDYKDATDLILVDKSVRRLTPVECERLQGFPDNYTLISYRKKPAEQCPDSPRYKALGNSMAVPVMRWIGERIAMVEAIAKNG